MSEADAHDKLIDAWLAGKLSPEESKTLEKKLHAPEPLADDAELLLNLDQHRPTGNPIDDLVSQVKTLSGNDLPKTSPDSWKEILTPSENTDLFGTLGGYEVLEPIATGGMASVLKARDPKLNRIVALKLLPPELTANSTARSRFLAEARAIAQLDHEHILPIYTVHEDQHTAFFAMRYVPTGSLQEALDRGETFDISRLKAIARGVASALDAAHTAGIIHRDIKPANILLGNSDDQVWVCDFGIARTTEDPSITHTGTVAGTPQYMSPEQAAGNTLDGRSDLFSLGSVLYRCATGEHVFSGTTTASVLQELAAPHQRPLDLLASKVPKWFERLITDLLAKSPTDRPPSAAAVVQSIDDETTKTKRKLPSKRSIAILATAVVLAFGLLQIPTIRYLTSATIANITDRPITISSKLGAFSNLTDAVAAARDGDTLSLRGKATLFIDNLVIPAGKSLTIASTFDDEKQILTTAIPGAPGIVTHSPLKLSGIDFRINPKENGDGILRLHNTSAQLSNCRITIPTGGPPESIFPQRAIELVNGGDISLIECQLDLLRSIAVSVIATPDYASFEPPNNSIHFEHCDTYAVYAIHTRAQSIAPRQLIKLSIQASNFVGRALFKHHPQAPITNLDVDASNNNFAFSSDLCWFQTTDRATVLDRFRWKAQNNNFPCGNDHLRVGNFITAPSTEFYAIRRFDPSTGTYIATTGEIDHDWKVKNAKTGELFASLQAAVAVAENGATLQLRGRLEFSKEFVTPAGLALNLMPVPGERASIVATSSMEHGLFLNGPATVTGIHFSRPSSDDRAWPVLGVNCRGGDALIEDCYFLIQPLKSGDRNQRALSLTNAQYARVNQCEFHVPTGTGILLATTDTQLDESNLHLTDCLFTGAAAVGYRSVSSNTKLKINANNCIIICNHALLGDESTRIAPLNASFSDSIIEIGDCLINLLAIPAKDIATYITWSGQHNHYREGMKILRSVPDQTELDTFKALQAIAPQTQDNNATYGNPFRRERLRFPYTPHQLLRALDPSINSHAQNSLKLLTTPMNTRG